MDREFEVDTPPHTKTKPSNPLLFTTAKLNNHDHLRLRTSPPSYKQCMKNHAATLGGYAVDGCGEYMPLSAADLKCAACGCHRNFHRRETNSAAAITPPFLDFRLPLKRKPSSLSPPSPPCATHLLLSLGTAAEAEERDREPAAQTPENPVGGKRRRTKFSREQKEKMRSFSEKLGWRMHRSDESAVEEFCREVGVAKGALKIWMHNNKAAFGKQELIGNGSTNDEEMMNFDDGRHFQIEGVNGDRFHGSNNGSSFSPSSD